jgi:hypothetical protein
MSSVSFPADNSTITPGEPELAPPERPETERSASSAASASLAVPLGAAEETHAMLAVIGRGFAVDADDAARSDARELWARLAPAIASAAAATSPVPAMHPGVSTAALMPMGSATPSPITAAARALRQLPPEQLLDLLLQRRRASLPAGATVAAAKGIQFQLVPVAPPQRAR